VGGASPLSARAAGSLRIRAALRELRAVEQGKAEREAAVRAGRRALRAAAEGAPAPPPLRSHAAALHAPALAHTTSAMSVRLAPGAPAPGAPALPAASVSMSSSLWGSGEVGGGSGVLRGGRAGGGGGGPPPPPPPPPASPEHRAPPIGGAFPDLTPAHRVTLELALAYPDFIRGAAWADARARLTEKGVALLPDDAGALAAALAEVAAHGARVAAVQRLHAAEAGRAAAAAEAAAMAAVAAARGEEEEAALFATRNARKPWVTQGKRFVGLTVEERRTGAEAREAMLARSLVGTVDRAAE